MTVELPALVPTAAAIEAPTPDAVELPAADATP
jgi:hypothetical protein